MKSIFANNEQGPIITIESWKWNRNVESTIVKELF